MRPRFRAVWLAGPLAALTSLPACAMELADVSNLPVRGPAAIEAIPAPVAALIWEPRELPPLEALWHAAGQGTMRQYPAQYGVLSARVARGFAVRVAGHVWGGRAAAVSLRHLSSRARRATAVDPARAKTATDFSLSADAIVEAGAVSTEEPVQGPVAVEKYGFVEGKRLADVEKALADLPDRHRGIALLRMAGMSLDRTAASLGTSKGAIQRAEPIVVAALQTALFSLARDVSPSGAADDRTPGAAEATPAEDLPPFYRFRHSPERLIGRALGDLTAGERRLIAGVFGRLSGEPSHLLLMADLYRAFASLDAKGQRVLALRFIAGRSQLGVSGILGVTKDRVIRDEHRAFKNLRHLLSGSAPAPVLHLDERALLRTPSFRAQLDMLVRSLRQSLRRESLFRDPDYESGELLQDLAFEDLRPGEQELLRLLCRRVPWEKLARLPLRDVFLALWDLPSRSRAALALRFSEGLAVHAVAGRLHMLRPSAYWSLERGLEALAGFLRRATQRLAAADPPAPAAGDAFGHSLSRAGSLRPPMSLNRSALTELLFGDYDFAPDEKLWETNQALDVLEREEKILVRLRLSRLDAEGAGQILGVNRDTVGRRENLIRVKLIRALAALPPGSGAAEAPRLGAAARARLRAALTPTSVVYAPQAAQAFLLEAEPARLGRVLDALGQDERLCLRMILQGLSPEKRGAILDLDEGELESLETRALAAVRLAMTRPRS